MSRRSNWLLKIKASALKPEMGTLYEVLAQLSNAGILMYGCFNRLVEADGTDMYNLYVRLFDRRSFIQVGTLHPLFNGAFVIPPKETLEVTRWNILKDANPAHGPCEVLCTAKSYASSRGTTMSDASKSVKAYRVSQLNDQISFKVILVLGEPGSGKTHWIKANYPAHAGVYWRSVHSQIWDGYDGEKTVVIDDYDENGGNALRQLLNRRPIQSQMGRAPIYADPHLLIISSTKHPKEWCAVRHGSWRVFNSLISQVVHIKKASGGWNGEEYSVVIYDSWKSYKNPESAKKPKIADDHSTYDDILLSV